MSIVIKDAVPDDAIGFRGVLGAQARVTLSGEIKRDSDGQSGQRRVHRIKGVSMPIEQFHGSCDMNGLIESLGSPFIRANYAEYCNENQDRCEKEIVAAVHSICARRSRGLAAGITKAARLSGFGRCCTPDVAPSSPDTL